MRGFPNCGVFKGKNKAAEGRAKKKDEAMKTTKYLTIAALAIFTAVNAASAAEPLLSPKAQALTDSLRTVSGTTPDLMDRSVQLGTPKGREMAFSLRNVVGATEDKVDRSVATVSPRARQLLGLHEGTYQVAPLK